MARKTLPPSDDPALEKRRQIQRRYYENKREKRKQWNDQWMMTNKDRYTLLRVQSNARRRRAVLLMYADPICCQRCGFDKIDGLVLDHIHDDGVHHRRELKVNCRGATGGGSMYEVIRRNGKIDKLQVLCANCNTMKHVQRLRAKTLGEDPEKIASVEAILRGET